MPGAAVATFEAANPSRRILFERFAGNSQVHVAPVALGRETGQRDLYYYPERPDLASFVAFPHGLDPQVLSERVVRGDEYVVDQLHWDRVDLLKVDTEGTELDVLRGFSRLFSRSAVIAAQFEYGRANILSRSLLRDLTGFLVDHGFLVGRVCPDGVDFTPYRLDHETFYLSNHIALHRDAGLPLGAVAGRWASTLRPGPRG